MNNRRDYVVYVDSPVITLIPTVMNNRRDYVVYVDSPVITLTPTVMNNRRDYVVIMKDSIAMQFKIDFDSLVYSAPNLWEVPY